MSEYKKTLVKEYEVLSWERNEEPTYEAVVNAKAAVNADPENAEKWMELGLAYAAEGYYREATECYSHAISIDPSGVIGTPRIPADLVTMTDSSSGVYSSSLRSTPNRSRRGVES